MKKKIFSDDAFLKGSRIYLRPLRASDINSKYLAWLTDAEVKRYIDAAFFPVTKEDVKEYYRNIKASKIDLLFAIVENSGEHIGNVKLGGINWVHRFADLGMMIGAEKSRGKGYGTEACTLLLNYAFYKLNLNKVFLGCHSNNVAAIRAYKKAGFRVEGSLRKMLYVDGKYVDKVLMGVLQSQFKRSLELSAGNENA